MRSTATAPGDARRGTRAFGFTRLAGACGLAAIGVGGIVLLAWLFDLPSLTRWSASQATMKANTAVGFVLLGASQVLISSDRDARKRAASKILAGIASLLGAITLAEEAFGWEAGVDQWLVVDRYTYVGASGRMAPATAVHFVLLGLSLLGAGLRFGRVRPSEWLALLVGASSFVAILGYLYGVRSLYAVTLYASVAAPTAITFLVLSAGILCLHAEQGVMRWLNDRGAAGVLSRRLLPAALLVPVVVGWFRLQGQRAGYYGTEFGLAIYATCSVVGFTVLVWWTAAIVARSEADRAQAEVSLSATLNSIADGVIATDAEGLVTLMNPVAERLTGYNYEELQGRALAERLHVVDELTGKLVDDWALREPPGEGSLPTSRALILTAKDHSERIVTTSAASIDGRGTVFVLRDETEERIAQRALRDSEARKTSILEAALDGIIEMDHRGVIIGFNTAAERTFGFRRQDVIGRELADCLIPEALRERHRAGLARYIGSGEAMVLGRRVELTALRANGTAFPVELAVVRIRCEGPPTFTGYIRDLTERNRAETLQNKLALEAQVQSVGRERAERALIQTEEQLRQSQKMDAIGKLAGGIAHDFNNLLTVIQSYAALVLADLPQGSALREEVSQISRASQRASSLTRQLLAFSRQQVLNPRALDLNEVVDATTLMFRRMIGEDIELTKSLKATGFVLADVSQMEQVLLNLVVNARDAMPSGGKLTIETCDTELDEAYANDHFEVAPGRYVSLIVSDTGSGMDRATQNQIFEPFFTTKERGKGTGLGLSTVFGIVKQSGGNIWVYSEVGHGTTFKVHLPRLEADDHVVHSVRPSPARSLRGVETILLVEDDEQLRTLARTVLEKHGYTVIEAAAGREALRVCDQYNGILHLLLTDVVMPHMSGSLLAEQLRGVRPTMKVIFMSGYTDETVVRHGVLSSEMSFIQKPLVIDQLLAKVRDALDATG